MTHKNDINVLCHFSILHDIVLIGSVKKMYFICIITKLPEEFKKPDTSIEKVKPENYKNYFEYAYGTTKKTEYTRKPSTRKYKLKLYKDLFLNKKLIDFIQK